MYSLEELEKRIGYTFKDKALLSQAITHSSFSNERRINKEPHYERLEFLGDAVLELALYLGRSSESLDRRCKYLILGQFLSELACYFYLFHN